MPKRAAELPNVARNGKSGHNSVQMEKVEAFENESRLEWGPGLVTCPWGFRRQGRVFAYP